MDLCDGKNCDDNSNNKNDNFQNLMDIILHADIVYQDFFNSVKVFSKDWQEQV